MSLIDSDDEQERIAKLRELDILDTPAEPDFDHLTLLAAKICETPISLISFVDQDRQWFKSKIGLDVTETPRVVAFCEQIIHEKKLLIIPDAANDERFKDNPLVTGEPFIRFYAGVPLITEEGLALGTLNVIDTKPRSLTTMQKEVLFILARQAETLLKLREQSISMTSINQDLKASEENYRIVTQSVSDTIITIDENSAILFVSPAVEKILGYKPAEMIGQPLTMIIPQRLQSRHMAGLQRYKKSREKHILWNGIELPAIHRNGSEIQVEISFGEYRSGGESVFTAVIRDITSRKLTEEALKSSEQYHRSLFQLANDAIVIFNAFDETVFDVNERACQIYGIPREEFIGKSLKELSENPDGGDSFLSDLLRRGSGEEYETVHLRADGAPISFLVNASVIEYEGRPAVLSINRDITHLKQVEAERRHLEDQLRQAQKMESIGTLAGGIAHDFNNLLTVIIGNIQLARQQLDIGSRLETRLTDVEAAAGRAALLTEQLLAFSRRSRLERKSLNLNSLLTGILKMLGRLIGEDIEIQFRSTAHLNTIYADPGQIEQIVMNLAVNARDAMPEGGRLIIETHNIYLDANFNRSHPELKPGNYVRLRVSDTGLGMTEDIRQRVFEPFFTTKGVGKGTGLGLSMIYGIVKQHDGHIDVYSEPGRGTTFKVYFPVEETGVPEETAPKPVPLSGGTETILVAEDEEPLRDLIREILSEIGYTVILAKDGAELVELFKQRGGEVDLVMIDLVMPRLSGTKAYEQIRALKADIPVIFMTGYSDKMIDHQPEELIQKPYRLETLDQKIREVLDRKTA
jgi:two-component system, cell cycle sensor histidine kinase and response regulator CckA